MGVMFWYIVAGVAVFTVAGGVADFLNLFLW